MKVICETARLRVRQFNFNDAEFIVRLLNEESFILNITDKNVRTNAYAINYLTDGPIVSYQKYGYGLNMVLLKGTETPIGMCGLLKRDELDYPDLGFAFLSEFWRKGYANEAAAAVVIEEMATHSLKTILAVTSPNNVSSNSLLNKVGFSLTGTMEVYGSPSNVYQYCV